MISSDVVVHTCYFIVLCSPALLGVVCLIIEGRRL